MEFTITQNWNEEKELYEITIYEDGIFRFYEVKAEETTAAIYAFLIYMGESVVMRYDDEYVNEVAEF